MCLRLWLLLSSMALGASSEQHDDRRRSLARFTKGNPQNRLCWDRELDGFHSVVDAHNHFQAFHGPSVPFDTYINWMIDYDVLFAVVVGLGQVITKTNPSDPECCYYLDCPTTNYTVRPSTQNDYINAELYTTKYLPNSSYTSKIKLFLSATFADLQTPTNNMANLDNLTAQYPGAFSWFGEVNLIKQALAGNGFFNVPVVTEAALQDGMPLNALFRRLEALGWPVTLHADLGCDNFNMIPGWQDKCNVSTADQLRAQQEFQWWSDFLGPYYPGFFNNVTNYPLENFRKIQYLKLFDDILATFPALKVTWAHMGLSMELLRLHPSVHVRIIETLFQRRPKLIADISWDIIAKVFLLNYELQPVDHLRPREHEDLPDDSGDTLFNYTAAAQLRSELVELFNDEAELNNEWGINMTISGPTLAFAVYHPFIHAHSERFITGIDFVASYGTPQDYPGIAQYSQARGVSCQKQQRQYASQLIDTSAINIFLDDTAFRNIVLGDNFFRLVGANATYGAPPMCTDDDDDEESGLPTYAVALIIASVLLVIVLCVSQFWFKRIHKQQQPKQPEPDVPLDYTALYDDDDSR